MLSDVGHGGEFERYSDYAVQVDFHAVGFCLAFVQSAFYGGYFLIAIPASRVIRRWSYKVGILIGLVCYIGGCTLFFPASHMATYGVFLMALFAIAVGLSFLETSCNTYSSMIGDRAERELHAAFEYFANVHACGLFERHPAG